MNPEPWSYLLVLPITFAIEYLRIFVDTEYPSFWKGKIKLPFFLYMGCQWAVSFIIVLLIIGYRNPPNFAWSLAYPIIASFIATGVVTNTEIKFLDFNINHVKTKTDEWRDKIVSMINKEKTSSNRELASRLITTKKDLRQVLLGIMDPKKFNDFEQEIMSWKTDEKPIAYARKIVQIDPDLARKLV
jgi:hypothetical protein